MIDQVVQPLYTVKVTEVGKEVPLFAEEEMMVLFNEDAPPELRDICVLHSSGELSVPLQVGDVVLFDQEQYRITAIGDEANRTLAELGHVTFKFDGCDRPSLPGTIHLERKAVPNVTVGTVVQIKRYL